MKQMTATSHKERTTEQLVHLEHHVRERYRRRYDEWLRLDRAARRMVSRWPDKAARYRARATAMHHLMIETLYVLIKVEERAHPDRALPEGDAWRDELYAKIDAQRAQRRETSSRQ